MQAEVQILKLDRLDPLPEALLRRVRDEAARADRETKDVYARQAVISGAADLLEEAGLMRESDALLTAELERSHSPYYYMLGLASNAKKRGDKAAALDWEEKAYAAAKGPATRLQWGAHYVNALVDLAPEDAARIEHAAASVIAEIEPVPDTFYDRNRRVLERMSKKLADWGKSGARQDSLKRLRSQMAAVCGKLPPGDAAVRSCQGLLGSGTQA
jgi:hypothetical protein